MSHIEIFWVKGETMKCFHAIPSDSATSLCRRWFVGGACLTLYDFDKDIHEETEKCKACKRWEAYRNAT